MDPDTNEYEDSTNSKISLDERLNTEPDYSGKLSGKEEDQGEESLACNHTQYLRTQLQSRHCRESLQCIDIYGYTRPQPIHIPMFLIKCGMG